MSAKLTYRFVDTNILVYAYDTLAGEKRRLASELLDELWINRTGCLSIQVLQEFYVVITQKVKNPLDSMNAAQIITDLSRWKIHSPSPQDVITAIDIQRRFQINFWDAMILQSAQSLGCEIVWSEDLNPDQIYDSVVVSNPFLATRT
jgi:predicted nucleic acid-binding protein